MKTEKFWHGADYYPEQWLDRPDILEEDIRLMKQAGICVVTLGVFAWAMLEPEEGKWNFDWLDAVMDRLYQNGIGVILATPSGARPAWLAKAYPEVLRTMPDRRKNLYGMRMNHCYTSPKYRELTVTIDRRLAARYGTHPALKAWHISNEYHGECHCTLCQEAFREFLKEKYTTLEALNKAWWTVFWSKRFTDWNQIESPSPIGEMAIQGLILDWKRFVTQQTKAFMDLEIAAVRENSPFVPITTNMIGSFPEVDYHRLAESLDIASIDLYPDWLRGDNTEVALQAGFEYDVIRSLKRKPFLLMETTPSMTNWTEVGKGKGPGVHLAACLQAVAHGADSVQYFQWRKSRGAFEKFHGAVIGHDGSADTRVFREVAQAGETLAGLSQIAGAVVPAQTAILYDWNNRWAIDGSKGPRRDKAYEEIVREHYGALRRHGINVDLLEEGQTLEEYKLVAAPMLYLLKEGMAKRLSDYVKAGGTLVLTYLSGITDENDLCFEGGFPGPLRELAGIWVEELDTLYPEESNQMQLLPGNSLGLEGTFSLHYYCEVIHLLKAVPEAVYQQDYYQGLPALTSCVPYENPECGRVYYMAARTDKAFLTAFYGKLLRKTKVAGVQELPEGIECSVREKDGVRYLFYTNWKTQEASFRVPCAKELLSDRYVDGMLTIPGGKTAILEVPCAESSLMCR